MFISRSNGVSPFESLNPSLYSMLHMFSFGFYSIEHNPRFYRSLFLDPLDSHDLKVLILVFIQCYICFPLVSIQLNTILDSIEVYS